ncbi:MAG: thiamine pyrophosphate-dependent dehydrogenase E1 component subunit alpha [Myxococcota bacterium]|nr:thiamine pyrophosphate-dependent dehydrogenase E1 component subunit alpha [Myxococcota bacterium]
MRSLPSDDPTLTLFSVLREDGTADPQSDSFLPKEMLLEMYRQMLRIRRIDERMLGKQRQGKVGFYGTITGQEATPIATGLALAPQDWVFPALREAAVMLVRGFPLGTWLAQVYGNAGDLLKGRQMPSHQSGRAVNQVAWSSCIGPQIPQAVGAAMAMKRRGQDAVSVGFMGDGATSQPDFHAAMTFAGIWKPPVVLICQNNHWSISVPTDKQTASKTIAIKAHAYGIRGVRVDGNDVLAVHRVVKEAVDRARAGDGPTFVESVTYRMGPHSSSDDPTRYRSNDEVEAWGKKDPLARLERYLRAAELLDDETKTSMEEALREELDAALAQVEELGPPSRASVFEDIYATLPPHLEEQREQHLELPPAPRGH